jgi:hypothetical protein
MPTAYMVHNVARPSYCSFRTASASFRMPTIWLSLYFDRFIDTSWLQYAKKLYSKTVY